VKRAGHALSLKQGLGLGFRAAKGWGRFADALGGWIWR
jgi:hypothetical protein